MRYEQLKDRKEDLFTLLLRELYGMCVSVSSQVFGVCPPQIVFVFDKKGGASFQAPSKHGIVYTASPL